MTQKTAIISGVGDVNGMGAQLALRFAGHGLHVFVGGRTQERLDKVVAAVQEAGGKATAVVCDATQEDQVKAFVAAAASAGPIDLAIYNTGNNMPGNFLEMESSYFEQCWRICSLGAFMFSREVLNHMVPNGQGTLLFTGASASMRGKPFFAAFTAAKASMRAMAQSLAREFQPQGIHVGHVVIDGAIDGNQIRSRPQIVEMIGEERLLNIQGLVDAYEYLYTQPTRAWTHELDVRSEKEPW